MRSHPLGKAPVLIDGATTLAEPAPSPIMFARDGPGRLAVGPEAPNFARDLSWLHYAEGSLMLPLPREYALDPMLPYADRIPAWRASGRARGRT